nr:hypothetical protein [Moritella viscosa]SHO17370.1 Putative uncharacterized protein [Moritella viscosa]
MRYQSLPSSYSEINQETTKERALRQRLERRAELTYTADDYQRWAKHRNRVIAEREKAKADAQSLPSYLTGDAPKSTTGLSYPAIKNTRVFPDENVRALLKSNDHDVMLLVLLEAFEVLQSWGWKDTKEAWVETTQSTGGEILVSYGVNGKDIVTTSMIISKLGDFGIKATKYVNHKGTELIKLSGYAGIRKILNAPVFAEKNPKIVGVGIGKYGLKNSIIQGARLTFYVAAAYRVVDFILNDETSLAEFIGSLATDIVKIGIASGISWVAGTAASGISFVVFPLVIVVVAGIGAAWGLNYLDSKYKITDQVVVYIESAQQEVMEKAQEIEDGFWDIGEMFAQGMLEAGRNVIESEVRKYIRTSIEHIKPRLF